MIHVNKAVLGGTMSFWLNTTGSLYVWECLQDVILSLEKDLKKVLKLLNNTSNTRIVSIIEGSFKNQICTYCLVKNLKNSECRNSYSDYKHVSGELASSPFHHIDKDFIYNVA